MINKYKTQRNINSKANLEWRHNLSMGGKNKILSEKHKGNIRKSCQGINKGNKRLDLSLYNKKRKGIFKQKTEVKKKIGIAIHKHHLDLNKNNNKESNLLRLRNSKHQKLHRLAYHYLLEKFGIKEIRKYVKWFKKRYGDKNEC